MVSQQKKTLWLALAGLVGVWLLAWLGYRYFAESKMTAEKVAAYVRSVDLSKLSGEQRVKALRELARRINALPPAERRNARLEGRWQGWFEAMTEQERNDFIEATVPSGFKQMLSSFEQLPEERRKRAVDEALRGLAKARQEFEANGPSDTSLGPEDRRMGELSPELREKVIKLGLKSFYTESSAQTKAELAPVLEEMQRLMERGVVLRGLR